MSAQREKSVLRVSSEDKKRWRNYEDTLRSLERLATLNPDALAVGALFHALGLKRKQQSLRDHLRLRYGVTYNIERTENEDGFCFSIRRVVTYPKRLPRTRSEKARYETAVWDILTIEAFLQELFEAVSKAEDTAKDVARAMCDAFLWHFRHLPGFYGVRALMARYPAVQERALLELSAWLDQWVSLRVPRRADVPTRTKRALDDEGVTLDEALPAAALDCLPDWPPDEPLRRPGGRKTSLVSRVEGHMAGRGSERAEKPEQFADEPTDGVTLPEAELAAFIEREWLAALVREAGLSAQEREVFELAGTHDNGEIAEKVGRPRQQVRVEKWRAIKKVRRAAGL